MLALAALLIAAFAGVSLLQSLVKLRKNVQIVKNSGVAYINLPVYRYNIIWNIISGLVTPLMEHLLPQALTKNIGLWGSLWKPTFDEFERVGSIFFSVAPGRISLDVADAQAIAQITTRRADFPKPLELYGATEIFGKNLISVEGATWKIHRKIAQPSFSEKNNRVVWAEALHQGQAMVENWFIKGDETSGVTGSIRTLAQDTMRLSLAVISKAGFGREVLWPFEEERRFGPGGEGLPEGHEMTYTYSMRMLVKHLLWVLIPPNWLRSVLPFENAQLAHKCYLEWSKYLREIFAQKKAMIEQNEGQEGLDLMGAFIRGAKTAAALPEAATAKPELESTSSLDSTLASDANNVFSDNEILGNAFLLLLAGHETVANTLHHMLVFLALHPRSQCDLQQSLDDIFGERAVAEWDYDEDLPKLFNSMTGAVMHETLRLLPPIPIIPKSTNEAQQLTLSSGKKIVVPGNTMINVLSAAAHRNPECWPRLDKDDAKDLNKFKPRRWLDIQGTGDTSTRLDTSSDSWDADDGVEKVASTKQSLLQSSTRPGLYVPPKGAYLPFSDGPRSCIGRRFAQVETFAVVAVIFRHFTAELDLAVADASLEDEANLYDENLRRQKAEDRRRLWNAARDRTADIFENKMTLGVSLKMGGGARVPIRLVKRGKERLRREEMEDGVTAGF